MGRGQTPPPRGRAVSRPGTRPRARPGAPGPALTCPGPPRAPHERGTCSRPGVAAARLRREPLGRAGGLGDRRATSSAPRASPAFGGGGAASPGSRRRERPLLQGRAARSGTSPPPTSPPPTSPGQAEEAAGRPVLCVGSQEKEDVSEKYARDWGVQCTRVSVQSQERGRVCLANFSLLNDVSSVILGGVHLAPSSPP